jgi:serum/glucocorticoid-regulated kinase 2
VYVALKVIDKDFLLQNDKGIIVHNEKKILTELNHPFITKVYYTIETEKKISIALEYCSGGELFYLLKRVKRMRESEARFYFLEVLSALKALHEKNMVYRDLKPENIIIY